MGDQQSYLRCDLLICMIQNRLVVTVEEEQTKDGVLKFTSANVLGSRPLVFGRCPLKQHRRQILIG